MAVKRAKAPFTWMAMVGGRPVPRTVNTGQLFDESEDVVQRHPWHFEDADEYVGRRSEARARVEQASADPGEQRSITPPKPRRKKRSEQASADEVQAAELGLVNLDDSD